MWPYWLVFLTPAAAAFRDGRLVPQGSLGQSMCKPIYGWCVLIAFLMLFIGFRHKVCRKPGIITHWHSRKYSDYLIVRY